jgi:hypothetical protein
LERFRGLKPLDHSKTSAVVSAEAEKPLNSPPTLPTAWQPLTFGGVAAFGQARWLRLFAAQVVVAGLVGAGLIWFLSRNYSPVVAQFIEKLPATACLTNGQLSGLSGAQISESKFLSLAITDDDDTAIDQSADVQIALHKDHMEVATLLSSALGSLEFNYSTNANLDLSQSHLEPLWGAWHPIFLAAVGLGTIIWLFLVWSLLAALYTPVAKLVAWFGNRPLTWLGAWRLSSAALLPGAILLTLGIVLYGHQIVDLIGLGYFQTVHFVVGWIYVLLAPLFSPRANLPPPGRNPFAS